MATMETTTRATGKTTRAVLETVSTCLADEDATPAVLVVANNAGEGSANTLCRVLAALGILYFRNENLVTFQQFWEGVTTGRDYGIYVVEEQHMAEFLDSPIGKELVEANANYVREV